jgi:hypothetical protein
MKYRLAPLPLLALAAAAALSASIAPPAAAGEAECALHRPAPIERQLRKLSLVLRGHVPEYEEYAPVDGLSTIPEKIIDDYLASDEFRLQMRRFHEDLLLANPTGASLHSQSMIVNDGTAETTGSTTKVWQIPAVGRRKTFRGGNGSHLCQDKNQNALGYEADGTPKCEVTKNDMINGNPVPVCQEGWKMVAPYWDPQNPIKVCAFDAQDTEEWSKGGKKYSCDSLQSQGEPSCACGPSLNYCFPLEIEASIWDNMREQLLLVVDDHTSGDHPYSELLTTKQTYTNGLLDHYKKYLAPQSSYAKTYNAFHKGDAPLPDKPDWTDTTFKAQKRTGIHSGVLTLPAYTLRFQTNRARANRFRIAFLGQYFVPPSDPNLEGCTDDAKDLTQRCYCRDCHRVLEPMAAHFSQVAEAGSGLLSDFAKIAYTQAECNAGVPNGNGQLCTRFYAQAQAPDPDNPKKLVDAWRLLPLEYAADHPEYEENFDAGPAALAQQAIDDGTFARSTVTHLFSFLVRREMNLDPASDDNEIALLEELTKSFQMDDHLPRLAKQIVTLPVFGRMP